MQRKSKEIKILGFCVFLCVANLALMIFINNENGIKHSLIILLLVLIVSMIGTFLYRTMYFSSILNKNDTLAVFQFNTYDKALIFSEKKSLVDKDKIVCTIVLQIDIRIIDSYIKKCIGSVIYTNDKQKNKFFNVKEIEKAIASFEETGFTTHFELRDMYRIEQILKPHIS